MGSVEASHRSKDEIAMMAMNERDCQFHTRRGRCLESIALGASAVAAALIGVASTSGEFAPGLALVSMCLFVMLAVFYAVMAHRWQAEWLVCASELALVGAYLYQRVAHP